MAKPLSRKEFLQTLTLLGAGLASPALLSSCSLFDEPEMRVCSVAELKDKPYLVVQDFFLCLVQCFHRSLPIKLHGKLDFHVLRKIVILQAK